MLVVGPAVGGWWLDDRFGTSPTIMLVSVGLGSFAGFWLLFKTARQMSKDAEALDERERRRTRRDD